MGDMTRQSKQALRKKFKRQDRIWFAMTIFVGTVLGGVPFSLFHFGLYSFEQAVLLGLGMGLALVFTTTMEP